MNFHETRMMREEELTEFYRELVSKKYQQVCPRCTGSTRIERTINSDYETNVNVLLKCRWSKCKFTFSMWQKTIFYNLSINHISVLKVINMWSIGASISLISNVLQCSSDIVKDIYKIMRNYDLYNKYLKCVKKLGGRNTIVEIDERKIGKNKHNRGHTIKGFWTIGMVERTEKRKIIIIRI